MNNYKIYIHTFPNNKKYIGMTCQKGNNRFKGGCHYTGQFVERAIKKYGWKNVESKIIFNHLTKEEAEQKEIEMIALHKSNNRKYGYNVSNGGCSIGRHTERTKELLSVQHTKNRKGERYGYLTIIRHIGSDKYRHSLWECKCDCGNTKIISINNVINSGTVSCGCFSNSLEYKERRYKKQPIEITRAKTAEYYHKNKDTILFQSKAYYNKNRDIILSKSKDYQCKNKNAISAYHKDYYNKNRITILAQKKEQYKQNKSKENN